MKKYACTVGIFDSGIGGLTVLKECLAGAPACRYLYYGDNLRAPYGERSPEEILSFVREALKKFKRRRVDAVVIACNTATAVAVDAVRRELSFPISGMEPAVKPAAERGGNILVLSTPRTAESARMKMLTGRFPDCRFRVFPAPALAGAIERCLTKGETLYLAAHLPEGKYDSVVLGCTHYVFYKKEIADFYAAKVFDGSAGTAKRLFEVIRNIDLGRADHLLPTKNPNNCFSFCEKNSVKFVGKCRKINKSVFLRTFVLESDKIN